MGNEVGITFFFFLWRLQSIFISFYWGRSIFHRTSICGYKCVWKGCSYACADILGRKSTLFKKAWQYIVLPPGGSPCPPSRMLVEKERCNEQPCTTYHWQPARWTHCQLVGRSCGAGYQSREVHCFKDRSEKVSPKRYVGIIIWTVHLLDVHSKPNWYSLFKDSNNI